MFSLTSTASWGFLFLAQGPRAVQTGSNIVNGEELLNLAPSHVNLDPLLMLFANVSVVVFAVNVVEFVVPVHCVVLVVVPVPVDVAFSD
jgi:hypothetical protein